MAEFTQAIVDWLQSIFHNNFLVTAVISVIPMIEVRGAITVGNNLGMNPWYAYLLSCCSALLVCPILLLCLKPILNALKKTKPFRNFAVTVEETFRSRAEMIENNAEKEDVKPEDTEKERQAKRRFGKILGVFLFVAIPLPLTGVWTGSAVAAFLNLEYRYSVPAIVVGNFVAGLIITVINILLGQYSALILLVLAVLALATIIFFIVVFIIKYRKLKKSRGIKNQEEQIEKIEDEG